MYFSVAEYFWWYILYRLIFGFFNTLRPSLTFYSRPIHDFGIHVQGEGGGGI